MGSCRGHSREIDSGYGVARSWIRWFVAVGRCALARERLSLVRSTGLDPKFHARPHVRPSPLPTAASGKAAERPRAVSRVELSVVESRSNSFRRSPEHLWPCRSCRRRQGQTCTHDSRDDLLQSRAVRTTRSTGWSNSTSGQFVRFAPCDLGVAAQHLVSSSAAVQRAAPGSTSELHCERAACPFDTGP